MKIEKIVVKELQNLDIVTSEDTKYKIELNWYDLNSLEQILSKLEDKNGDITKISSFLSLLRSVTG